MIDVIIVDDDANVRHGITELICWESLGANLIMACKNGQEVIDYLKGHRVDLIISDVMMPKIDGLELSKHVSDLYPDTSIILLSAYNEFELVQKAMQYGVREYILKPVNKEKIRRLSELIKNMSDEKEQLRRLHIMLYGSDFSKMLRKALAEKKMNELERIFSVSSYFKKTSESVKKEYYAFVFNILSNYAREVNAGYVLEENVLYEFSRCAEEDEYKKFLIGTYEQIILKHTVSNINKEKVNMEEIKKYIDKHFTEKGFSTFDVVKRFNYSNAYLCTAFKKKEGRTIVDYITAKKIEYAASLIKETDLSIKYIAATVGYDNIQYFSNVFKSIMNMSPTEYCSKVRNEVE